MPGAAERRMVGYPILDAELAKPPICQIDLHLRAQPPLRADRKHIANYQHPDHQHRIDRRPTSVRVVSRKLLVHPIKIENAVDLSNQMIGRYRLVEIERVEELTLPALSPPHHRPLPANRSPDSRNHGSTAVSTRVLQHNPLDIDQIPHFAEMTLRATYGHRRAWSPAVLSKFDEVVNAWLC